MMHLAGINKGPVLDWTDNDGLLEWFRKWKKKVEILFKGLLNNANDPVKCNYIIYWSGEVGMELVDKWEIKGKIDDGNWNNINRYFELFENILLPDLTHWLLLWNSRDCSRVPWVWKMSTQKLLDWWRKQSIQRKTNRVGYWETL